MNATAIVYMQGALTALCVVVALVFGRLWRRSHDRFYLIFAIAFVLFAAHWCALGVQGGEHALYPYMTRLLAFVTILVAIVDKNRRG
jgi:hypothetical protein